MSLADAEIMPLASVSTAALPTLTVASPESPAVLQVSITTTVHL